MEITASQVMALREKTGVSMMAVKKALVEAGGDEAKAVDILRKRGEAKSAEKSSRATGQGAVAMVMKGHKACALVLRCETDFVARNSDFLKLAETLAMRSLEQGEAAQQQNDEEVKAAVNTLGENIQMGDFQVLEAPVLGSYVHTNKKIGVVVGLDSGTPEQARDTAMHAAAMNPSFTYPEDLSDENTLSNQAFVKNPEMTVGKYLGSAKITQYLRVTV